MKILGFLVSFVHIEQTRLFGSQLYGFAIIRTINHNNYFIQPTTVTPKKIYMYVNVYIVYMSIKDVGKY